MLKAIAPLKPTKIYVACDGPHPARPEEAAKVSDTRDVIDQMITWPCQIAKLYSDKNLGCRKGVSNAISWFFEQEEEGIILEDDCVPHPDFFALCTHLLEKYRHDQRIWCISGNNFQDGQLRGDGSYYFSRYNHCWGWASWRRCWEKYDPKLSSWPEFRDSGLLDTVFEDQQEKMYWHYIWETLHSKGEPDTWDYQWTFTCLVNGGLTALPNENLVSNIGFGADATHTIAEQKPTSIDKGIGKVIHPSFILRDLQADQYTFTRLFSPRPAKSAHDIKSILKGLAKATLRRIDSLLS